MARRRQARRCRARRTNGEPCKAWAIVGGSVCRAHGGSAPQVRRRAAVRQFEASAYTAFEVAYARWQREVQEWHVGRVMAAADHFGIAPETVTQGDLLAGYMLGVVPSETTKPRIRVDRRYGPRK